MFVLRGLRPGPALGWGGCGSNLWRMRRREVAIVRTGWLERSRVASTFRVTLVAARAAGIISEVVSAQHFRVWQGGQFVENDEKKGGKS